MSLFGIGNKRTDSERNSESENSDRRAELMRIAPDSSHLPRRMIEEITPEMIRLLEKTGFAEQSYGTPENPAHNFRLSFRDLDPSIAKMLEAIFLEFFDVHPEAGFVFRVNNNQDANHNLSGDIVGLLAPEDQQHLSDIIQSLDHVVSEVVGKNRRQSVLFMIAEAPADGMAIQNIGRNNLVSDALNPNGLTDTALIKKIWREQQGTLTTNQAIWVTREIPDDPQGGVDYPRDELTSINDMQIYDVPRQKLPRGAKIAILPNRPLPNTQFITTEPDSLRSSYGKSRETSRYFDSLLPNSPSEEKPYVAFQENINHCSVLKDFSGFTQLVHLGLNEAATYAVLALLEKFEVGGIRETPRTHKTEGDSQISFSRIPDDFPRTQYIQESLERVREAGNQFLSNLEEILVHYGIDRNLLDEHFFAMKVVTILSKQPVTNTAFRTGDITTEEMIASQIGDKLEMMAKTGGFNYVLATDEEMSDTEAHQAFGSAAYMVQTEMVNGIPIFIYRVNAYPTPIEGKFLGVCYGAERISQDEMNTIQEIFHDVEDALFLYLDKEARGRKYPISFRDTNNSVLALAKIVHTLDTLASKPNLQELFEKVATSIASNFGTQTVHWIFDLITWMEVSADTSRKKEAEEYLAQIPKGQEIAALLKTFKNPNLLQ